MIAEGKVEVAGHPTALWRVPVDGDERCVLVGEAEGLWLWAVLAVMGFAPGLWRAIAIQALLEGLRSATVFIPAAASLPSAENPLTEKTDFPARTRMPRGEGPAVCQFEVKVPEVLVNTLVYA